MTSRVNLKRPIAAPPQGAEVAPIQGEDAARTGVLSQDDQALSRARLTSLYGGGGEAARGPQSHAPNVAPSGAHA
jgi:hypothetical protein